MASTGHDFVFSANKALVWRCCTWWAIAMGAVLPAGLIASQQSGWMLWTRSISVDRTRFVFSANKALVWRRCARWAIAKGPVPLDACIAYYQSARMLVARSIGADQTHFCLFGE